MIKTYGKHHGVKLIGTLDYKTCDIFCIERERYDAKVFLSFLEKVVKRYPGEKILMVLDNERIHHTNLLNQFLKKHSKQLELFFFPPYSTELNLVEGLWGWLKKNSNL